MLCERGQHVQHEPFGVWVVTIYEVGPALHQRGNKRDVAPEPVRLRYHRRCLLPVAFLQGGKELRAIRAFLAALDFGVLGGELARVDMTKHGGALRFEA